MKESYFFGGDKIFTEKGTRFYAPSDHNNVSIGFTTGTFIKSCEWNVNADDILFETGNAQS